MNKLIACCGINCETCEARLATIKNDDKMRVEVAKKWCEMNHTDQITPESINCVGCRVEGPKFYFCSHMCEVTVLTRTRAKRLVPSGRTVPRQRRICAGSNEIYPYYCDGDCNHGRHPYRSYFYTIN